MDGDKAQANIQECVGQNVLDIVSPVTVLIESSSTGPVNIGRIRFEGVCVSTKRATNMCANSRGVCHPMTGMNPRIIVLTSSMSYHPK